MKNVTTIVCCVALMIAGAITAFWNYTVPSNKTAVAATIPQLSWAPNVRMPLDLQLDLEKRQNHASPIKDSINLIDSVRIVTKVRWKTRYRDEADRTAARDAGTHLAAVNPDSLPKKPAIPGTVVREENATDTVGVSKTPSIQLSVDGEVVYSSNDSHSTEGGQ